MLIIFCTIVAIGIGIGLRTKSATREYNRRVWPSMQEVAPLHLRPILYSIALGLALALVTRIVPAIH